LPLSILSPAYAGSNLGLSWGPAPQEEGDEKKIATGGQDG